MAISFAKETYQGKIDALWRGECEVLPGGFNLENTIASNAVVKRGQPVRVDFDNMTAAICKTAKVVSGGTTTKPRVTKGSLFAVGDIVTKYGNGAKSPSISAIDTSNASYDVLTLSAAYTGLTADDILVESTEYGYYDAESGDEGALKVVASGASTGQINLADVTPYKGTKTLAANDYVVLVYADAKYIPNAVVAADHEAAKNGVDVIDAAYGARVLYDKVDYQLVPSWVTGICLKNNPNIIFIRQ